jgi:AraC family transcriptional regulator of adaptative response / DNA-3-methyladenine glycosylase II
VQQDAKTLYRALLARDRRFDGVFFVGVISTGIYCRPICPTKPPKEINCRFYDSAAQSEQAGFRPCLRCRPELAPGLAPIDDSERIAHLLLQRIEEGLPNEPIHIEDLARQFDLSSRHMRRIIQKELGVSPIQLLLTRRLLLAKQLLTETKLPMMEIAFASGFSSLRRFNDAFSTRYRMAPTRLRKKTVEESVSVAESNSSSLRLAYRTPYDWPGMLAFLKMRELKGVEWVTESSYARTVGLGKCRGWIKVTRANQPDALVMEFSHGLMPVLPALLSRVRDLFDLNARPELISSHLAKDPLLVALVNANPGLRVPGAFDGFELGLRAILGQQITVEAATTLAGRVVMGFGEPLITPFPELDRLTPAPQRIARATVDGLAKLGIISARCRSIVALAAAHLSGTVALDSRRHFCPESSLGRLTELPGIGPWTANYLAMRVWRWPDAFPKEDVGVRRYLGGVSSNRAAEMSQGWRPWRSYAVLHIWSRQTAL